MDKFKKIQLYGLLDENKYPNEIVGRFNSFITTQFDDSLSVEMQLRSIMKWLTKNLDLQDQNNQTIQTIVNDLVEYVNEFSDVFDEKLSENVINTLNEWQLSGRLDELIDDALQTQLDDVTAQLALIDYKEINPHEYIDHLENDDWTTVIHKIFEENESGVIKFPVGTFKFKTPIGRIKNNFIISGVNRYQTTFNLDLTGDYFVRAGVRTGFTNIGMRIDQNSAYPENIFDYNSNALGVTHPGTAWVFDVHNIYFDNAYDNVVADRLPNLFGVHAQNFDDAGAVNKLCSYIMYFNPYDIKFSGVNKFVDFTLTQKNGGNTVWATEVNFEKIVGIRLKKGLEIIIDNQSLTNFDQISDLHLTDVSLQGNLDGSFDNENWTQTEFLNIYGDENRVVTINLQGATKFWDTDLSGYLDYGAVRINGEFLYADWDSSVTENRKLGFVLGRKSTVDWIGKNPDSIIIEKGTNNRHLRIEPTDFEDGGVGEQVLNTPDYYGYGNAFVTKFNAFHTVNDPDRTSDSIVEFYNKDHNQYKLTSIKWGGYEDFGIRVRDKNVLKQKSDGLERGSAKAVAEWFGANGVRFEMGGHPSEYVLNAGETVVYETEFKTAFTGYPFAMPTLTGVWGSTFVVKNTTITKTGLVVTIENIGEVQGGVSLVWLAVGGGY